MPPATRWAQSSLPGSRRLREQSHYHDPRRWALLRRLRKWDWGRRRVWHEYRPRARGDHSSVRAKTILLTALPPVAPSRVRAATITLLGTGFGDHLIGGGGKDLIVGMDGNDDLKGGGQEGLPSFSPPRSTRNNNVDTVEDYDDDKLLLLDDNFRRCRRQCERERAPLRPHA